MVEEVWLHVGTPKSGTSSLQKHLMTHRDALAAEGLAYLAPEGRSSANDLAIAINKDRDDLAGIAAALNAEIETRTERAALISSEMFYGIAPGRLLALLPALGDRALRVLVYFRRQDRYIEAMFLQKSKNGRFQGRIGDYIDKFQGSGSDYAAMIAPWHDQPGAVLVPRILEPGRLTGGDVVRDALAQIGLPKPAAVDAGAVNVSPGWHRVQLLQAAARAGLANPRRLQRQLSAMFPQDPDDRAPVMDLAARRAYVARFAEGNETLRARYFPDQAALFDMTDLDAAEAGGGIPPFTEAQLLEITRLLQAVKRIGPEAG